MDIISISVILILGVSFASVFSYFFVKNNTIQKKNKSLKRDM
jgi:hypothetical protein